MSVRVRDIQYGARSFIGHVACGSAVLGVLTFTIILYCSYRYCSIDDNAVHSHWLVFASVDSSSNQRHFGLSLPIATVLLVVVYVKVQPPGSFSFFTVFLHAGWSVVHHSVPDSRSIIGI